MRCLCVTKVNYPWTRWFYSGLDDVRRQRLRKSGIMLNRPRGRDSSALQFEKRIVLRSYESISDVYRDIQPRTAVVESISVEEAREGRISLPSCVSLCYNLKPNQGIPSQHMHRCADTSRIDVASVSSSIIYVIEPLINVPHYMLEEAEIEVITAYRNIFYEAYESQFVDELRIPAISVEICGSRFEQSIVKLSQRALIKGFLRLSGDAKESFLLNRSFKVALYAPSRLFPKFEELFLEEPWPTPESLINPGRLTLYPGLPPPTALLQYDGWVGKRRELVDAVETKGKSLTGVQRQLDGRVVTEEEVLTRLSIAGRTEALKKTLDGERKTAEEEGLVARETKPLTSGLQGS